MKITAVDLAMLAGAAIAVYWLLSRTAPAARPAVTSVPAWNENPRDATGPIWL